MSGLAVVRSSIVLLGMFPVVAVLGEALPVLPPAPMVEITMAMEKLTIHQTPGVIMHLTMTRRFPQQLAEVLPVCRNVSIRTRVKTARRSDTRYGANPIM